MLKDITEVKYVDGYHVRLCFEDGIEGTIDVSELVRFTGVFAPLEDRGFFARVSVDPEIGTIVWPNGADLDPDGLYALVTGESIDLSEPTGVFVQ